VNNGTSRVCVYQRQKTKNKKAIYDDDEEEDEEEDGGDDDDDDDEDDDDAKDGDDGSDAITVKSTGAFSLAVFRIFCAIKRAPSSFLRGQVGFLQYDSPSGSSILQWQQK